METVGLLNKMIVIGTTTFLSAKAVSKWPCIHLYPVLFPASPHHPKSSSTTHIDIVLAVTGSLFTDKPLLAVRACVRACVWCVCCVCRMPRKP